MTNQKHPITPPPELVEKWRMDYIGRGHAFIDVAKEIAQWGADMELEEVLVVMKTMYFSNVYRDKLRAARRPKPPSLKEQALQVLASAPGPDYPRVMTVLNTDEHALIRQALEALPND